MPTESQKAASKAGFNFKSILKWGVIATIIMSVANFGQWYLPVATGFRGEIVEIDHNYVIMGVSGWKLLECYFIPGSEIGYVRNKNSKWKRVPFFFVNPRDDHRSRSLLQDWFGQWLWVDNEKTEFDYRNEDVEFKAYVQHSCEGGPLVETIDVYGNIENMIDPDSEIRLTRIRITITNKEEFQNQTK